MDVTFIGAGNMAEAIVSGILKNKLHAPSDICMTDINAKRLDFISSTYGVKTSSDNSTAVGASDIVILAVKPQIFSTVWPEIEVALKPDTLVISIMAGIPAHKIANGKSIRVVRVMPNTPSLVGLGAAGVAAGELATEEDVRVAATLMEAVGVVVVVKESDLDAVTALSGSGPAYIFRILESMIEGAGQMGLDKDAARKLALATVIGSATLMRETGEEPLELQHKVTSKGGTTFAALNSFEENGLKETIIAGMKAAQERSVEIANG